MSNIPLIEIAVPLKNRNKWKKNVVIYICYSYMYFFFMTIAHAKIKP